MIDVHGIVLSLHSLIDGALPGTQVLDGWNRSDDVQSQAVAVAIPPVQNAPAVSVRRHEEDGSLCDDRFDVTVHCAAASWDGDDEFTKKRAQVQSMIDAIDAAIEADRSLGGTVYDASVSPEQEWYQLSDQLGTTVQIDFPITVQVFG